MSDKPISVGDLVQIVKPRRCGCDSSVGEIFTVGSIQPSALPGVCVTCRRSTYERGTIRTRKANGHHVEIDRLKRIPPLSELEGEKRDEKLKEPA